MTQKINTYILSQIRRVILSELKDFIRQKFLDMTTKPNTVLKLIRHAQMDKPEKSKLVAFLQTIQRNNDAAAEIFSWFMQEKKFQKMKMNCM